MKRHVGLIVVVCVVLGSTLRVAWSRERSQIDRKYTWKLEDLYATDLAWEQAKDRLVGQFDDVLAYKGKLAGSAATLAECLELNSRISKELGRLSCYASMKSDQDTRDSKYLAMRQQIEQLGTDYGAKASFIEPEVAQREQEQVDAFIEAEPRLKVYRMYLDDIQRRKAHKLSEPEEKILAQARMVADGAASIYSVFSNAELPYPEVTLSDGSAVRLDKAGYALHRASANREDRQIVFEAFWNKFQDFRRTFGTKLYANVKADVFYARSRRYASSLESSLDRNNIPPAVYHALIKNVTGNLATFHRYLNLKKRMLGVEQLTYSDVYAPTVEGISLRYSFEEAQRLVLDSLRPLGTEYSEVTKKAFADRWIDVYPSTGKRAGAYSNGGAYDVHPYILLNYNGQYEDVSTLAHELGHALHSYLANKNQPYPTADYSIFVAEVASTFNEALLIHKMREEIEDKQTRLSLLMDYLEGIRTTVFRQTQFAEFELRIHEMVERGEPLTGDALNEVYGEILRKYYGHGKGVCHVDDLYVVEWAYVPHFYYNFYVYQYATSFTAATALSEKVLAGEPGAVKRYLAFLSAGGSEYPIDLLKEAGVDMTTSEPFEKTVAAMNRAMDEIEALLGGAQAALPHQISHRPIR